MSGEAAIDRKPDGLALGRDLGEAIEFQRLLRAENLGGTPERASEIAEQMRETGTYVHSSEELRWGARIAWRNTPRCIGKFYWKALTVRDMRHLTTAQEIFDALVEHLRLAYDDGRVRLLMTVFAARQSGRDGIRILNPQLVRYAGYRGADGEITGDPKSAGFTAFAQHLGWTGAGGRFDVLPLVIQMPGQAPEVFELPEDVAHEVPIAHPHLPWFADLGLRWHAFPSISDQCLRIGGLDYTAAPFSAWYTAAEIGARNLSDPDRYDMLRTVAENMGLDVGNDRSLWKDRALVELTAAVVHSYEQAGVSVIDHHFATRQFVRHEQREQAAGRETPACWDLIVPPISGSATPVWRRRYQPTVVRPNFFDQPGPYYGPREG